MSALPKHIEPKTAEYVEHITRVVVGEHKAIHTYAELGAIPYSRGIGIRRLGNHAGQRKLLLTEIEFLTTTNAGLIIYMGSAPCEKLPILLDMFPAARFLLIDPNYHFFQIPKGEAVYVYQNPAAVSADAVRRARSGLAKSAAAVNGGHRIMHYEFKQAMNAGLNYHPPMYQQSATFDMSRVGDHAHDARMRAIQKEFEEKAHRDLVRDIMRGHARAYIIQDYMSARLATFLAASLATAADTTCALISDIRSNAFGDIPSDIDYMWNDAIQLLVLRELRPTRAMLKFHPPYMDYETTAPLLDTLEAADPAAPGIHAAIRADLAAVLALGLDLIGNYKRRDGQYQYLRSSTIWVQAWSPSSSSEARLILTRADITAPFQTYSAAAWDDAFMYLKSIRGYAYFPTFYEKIRHRRDHTYDGCFDCMLELYILTAYLSNSEGGVATPADTLAAALGSRATQDALVKLRAKIDRVMIHSPYDKGGIHGHVVRRAIQPIFYVPAAANLGAANPDPLRFDVYQVWWNAERKRIETARILQVDIHARQFKYERDSRLLIAKNDTPASPREMEQFGRTWLRSVPEDE